MSYLEDCLKVKRQPIPECKLPRGGPSDQSPTLRGPGQGEYRALHLVRGRLYKLGRDCITGIVQVGGRRQHVWDVNVLRLQTPTVSPVTLPEAGLKLQNRPVRNVPDTLSFLHRISPPRS